jgi:hypothetical protein
MRANNVFFFYCHTFESASSLRVDNRFDARNNQPAATLLLLTRFSLLYCDMRADLDAPQADKKARSKSISEASAPRTATPPAEANGTFHSVVWLFSTMMHRLSLACRQCLVAIVWRLRRLCSCGALDKFVVLSCVSAVGYVAGR